MLRLEDFIVDAENDGGIDGTFAGSSDHNLFGTGVEVGLALFLVAEYTSRFDHDVNSEVAPTEVGRIALRGGKDATAIDSDGFVIGRNGTVELPMSGIVLQEIGQGSIVGEVVDLHDLNRRIVDQYTENQTSDASEAIDTNFCCHVKMDLLDV